MFVSDFEIVSTQIDDESLKLLSFQLEVAILDAFVCIGLSLFASGLGERNE